LYRKGVVSNDGFIAGSFDKMRFFREPIRNRSTLEFKVRLLRYNDMASSLLNDKKCDDLFIIGENKCHDLDVQDVNVEQLLPLQFQELKYILGVCETYE
jgi:hypothetical protein